MKYPFGNDRVSGLLVPLAALRSEASTGCGEFADLVPLGGWCAASGIALIQLLPVNDTGSQSSPYSALSAFALHPIYLRIEALPEFSSLRPTARRGIGEAIENVRARHDGAVRFDYPTVLADKMEILRSLFEQGHGRDNAAIDTFVGTNSWVPAYALFRVLKDRHDQEPWTHWDTHREMDREAILNAFESEIYSTDARFYAWVQMRCAEQFRSAVDALESAGIAIKGDLPILMNEDSADVWSERDVFLPQLRAGAPPDMFSNLGQNWDFPIYSWSILEQRNFDWWRERLRTAAAYYHAYRIDHVLGFFRIWAIPTGNTSGILGFFWPQDGITAGELAAVGFDRGRIHWLAEPHIEGHRLRELLGERWTAALGSLLVQVGEEDLYTFAPAIRGESDILATDYPDRLRETLLEWYRDRALIELPDGRFAAAWNFRTCSQYVALFPKEREQFENVVNEKSDRNDALWEREGTRLLTVLSESTDMLACAEDLGVVPPAVPRTLEALSILGLRIPRWTRRWGTPGEPMVPVADYPELSVIAPSVHDTSTLREWWEREPGRDELWDLAGGDGPCPESFSPEVARRTIGLFAAAASRILVLQLQDIFALTGIGGEMAPEAERINVPGSYNDFNWTYRMPLTIEQMRADGVLRAAVRQIAYTRAQ